MAAKNETKSTGGAAANGRKTIWQTLAKARKVGVPIAAIVTADQPAAVGKVADLFASADAPVAAWDVCRGWRGVNAKGAAAAGMMGGAEAAFSCVAALTGADKCPPDGVAVVVNAGRFLDDAPVAQALMNLRDEFKASGRMVILLGASIRVPAEIEHDVVVLDEPLPDAEELRGIVAGVLKDAGDDVENPAAARETIEPAVEAVRGLSPFAAEQTVAMSMTTRGVAVASAWERKAKQIESTPGLKVWRSGDSFGGIAGYENVKTFLGKIVAGNGRPNAVVFIDEIEKMFAGAGGDLSGVSQDQLGVILAFMQDTDATGALFVGPPGSGKSAVAKATGNEAGIPTIALDLGASRGSLVGQSEGQIRTALKVIESVSNGKSLWLATCNSMQSLPPELRRRFKLGTFFFDLPTATERAGIWRIYREQYGIAADEPNPHDTDWTGAEIRTCCENAWALSTTLADAADFVVPVALSAPERLEALRTQAEGRFLSATHRGTYSRTAREQPAAAKRRMRIGD